MKHFFVVFLGLMVMLPVVSLEAREPRPSRDSLTNPTQELRDRANEIRATKRFTRQPGVPFVEGEVLVKMGGERLFKRVRGSRGESTDELLAQYEIDGAVEFAEPNYIATIQAAPNDQYYKYQWNFDNPVNGGIHAEDAWAVTDGSGITVAVIDTGVAYEDYQGYKQAPDFSGTRFTRGYDFANNDSHANDDQGHGTHVAATIAQTSNNGLGLAGLAPGATIMPIKVLDNRGSGSYADIAAGIYYAADNGADVINLSLGGNADANVLKDAVAYAYNKGIVVVAASGNSGDNQVLWPAAYNDYVIAVGATRYDETKADYSNYGSALDLVAPGGDKSIDQNDDGYGDGILQQTFSGDVDNFGYFFYQGTSMAAPHVAGAAALIMSAGLANSPDAVQTLLQDTADDLGSNGRDDRYGHGLINLAKIFGGSTPAPTPAPEPQPEPEPAPAPVEEEEEQQEEDPEQPTEGEAVLFSESFEGSTTGWSQDGQNDWVLSRQRARDGARTAEVDGKAVDAQMISPLIALNGRSNITVSFSWLIESRVDRGEYLAFDVSSDGGSTWDEYERLRGNTDAENVWHDVSVELEDVNASNLRLRFRGSMSRSNEDANVDAIEVVGR